MEFGTNTTNDTNGIWHRKNKIKQFGPRSDQKRKSETNLEFEAREKLTAQAGALQTNIKQIKPTKLLIALILTLVLVLLLLLVSPLILTIYNINKNTLLDKITKALKQYISKAAEHVTMKIGKDKMGIWTKGEQLRIWTTKPPNQTTKPNNRRTTKRRANTFLRKTLSQRRTLNEPRSQQTKHRGGHADQGDATFYDHGIEI